MELARWAEQEFGRAELGDERRTRRLQQLGTAMAEHASSSLPEVCEDWAEQSGDHGRRRGLAARRSRAPGVERSARDIEPHVQGGR